jgi:hypothetical protein
VRFLRDEKCDRVVVTAHSMGTVIAYEGLTTIFERPEFQGNTKPMTFICLAQALRRIWLVTADDPHRLSGVLPDHVRWLHFWARYDPVSVGLLTSRSLPSPEPLAEPQMHASYQLLTQRLKKCLNRPVVNTDSTFTDHTTYWQNLEQVAGPIALELVAGHPQLEQVVQKYQASEAVRSPLSLKPVSNFFSFAGFSFVSTIVLIGIFMPVIVSTLINGAGELGIQRKMLPRDRGLVTVPIIALILLNVASLLGAIFVDVLPATVVYPVRAALFTLVALFSLLAASQALEHVVRRRRYGWLSAMFLTLLRPGRQPVVH